eukprot:gene3653-14894_t
MANNSTNSSIQNGIFLDFSSSKVFILTLYLIAAFAIFLNILEIRLITRKFKKATDFELVLLNLAFADLLSGLDLVVIAVLATFASLTEAINIRKHFGWIFAFILLSTSSSTVFVTIIGLERFFAIKVPIRHRMFHTGRRRLLYCLLGMWAFNLLITTLPVLIDYLVSSTESHNGSKTVGYVAASYLTAGALFVVVLYAWLGHLVMRRSVKLLDFDKKDVNINSKIFKRAMKKEKATICACILVLVLFLMCNLPFIVNLYQGKIDNHSSIMIKLNAVCNPLVYFFKNYLEKRYSKKNLVSSANAPKTKLPKMVSAAKSNSQGTANDRALDQEDKDEGPEGENGGSEGKSEGSDGKGKGPESESEGSDGKGEGSEGKSESSDGKDEGSEGKSGGSDGKGDGPEGANGGSEA